MAKYKFRLINRNKWMNENLPEVTGRGTKTLSDGTKIGFMTIRTNRPAPPARHGTCVIRSYRLIGPYVLMVYKTINRR